jgi:hypothetical protein
MTTDLYAVGPREYVVEWNSKGPGGPSGSMELLFEMTPDSKGVLLVAGHLSATGET